MSHAFRLALAAATACVLAGPAPAQSSQDHWPQTTSDLKPDPGVRFGVLANGLRYAVMHNDTPAGQTSLRLRIGSGSLEETDAEQGLAHVLEHMSFKGSTHVPPGDMIKILERDGLAFGPDTNAQTEFTQTVYELDLPKSDPALIHTGLMLLRETAGNLLIEPKELATERGVVLSEERLRDTPNYRAFVAQLDLQAHGQRITQRLPIGKVDVIEHAPASLIRQYYEANYRPDRATVIAVGDFDPQVMVAKIKAMFSDWTPVGPEAPAPDLGQVEKRGLTVKVVRVPGAQTLTDIAWVRPYDSAPDTVAKRRRETVENLALAVLDRRLSNLAHGDKPPFIAADASFDNLLHSDKVADVEAASTPDGWRPALTAIEQSVRQLAAYGVSKAEIDREIAQMRADLTTKAAGEATRPSPQLAAALVDSVDEDEVFTSPAMNLVDFDAAVKDVTPAEVNAAARAIFAGAGPLVEVESPADVDTAAVTAAYQAAHAQPVSAPNAEAAIAWPYTHFGAPGAVKSRTAIPGMDAVAVRFENGVGLIVKPTAFRKDQILVKVDLGHGRKDLPVGHVSPVWSAGAFAEGGFKDLSYQDSQRALAGHLYSAQMSVGDDAFELSGTTRPEDLATQMQVLTAYVTDPGYSPAAFERLRQAYLTALPQLDATPEGVLRRRLQRLIHNGDPRWASPDQTELDAAKPEDLKGLLGPALADAPIDITIVGDVTVDEAINQVAKTFGALPARPVSSPVPAGALQVAFPPSNPAPLILTDTGRADQALAIIAWPLPDFYKNTLDSRADMLAGQVLENRVLDKVRIAEGATYSPDTEVSLSESFPDYGFALALVEMPPAKIPRFYTDIAAITAAMRDTPVTADELERARNPRVASIRKAQQTNEYWLERLSGSLSDPRRLDLIRTTLPDYEAVSVADVQAAARRFLVPGKAWKLIIEAKSPAP